MRGTSALGRGIAWNIAGNPNGRKRYVDERLVAPNQHVVSALKNRVKSTSQKTGEKACMAEMMGMINCLDKFGKDQSMCQDEIKR